jgi:hypothetical protein
VLSRCSPSVTGTISFFEFYFLYENIAKSASAQIAVQITAYFIPQDLLKSYYSAAFRHASPVDTLLANNLFARMRYARRALFIAARRRVRVTRQLDRMRFVRLGTIGWFYPNFRMFG